MTFNEVLKHEIKKIASETVAEMLKPTEMLACLDDIAETHEVAKAFGVSDDKIRRKAKDGMPHTHIGRSYIFHKALLIEWTRNGSQPFPCVECSEVNVEPSAPKVLSIKTSTKLAKLGR